MKSSYIRTPESISIKSIEEKGFTLSSSQYMDLIMPNKNYKLVGDFLFRPLKRSDLGVEVGSINYITQSPFYFLRTKALQSHSFLPEITSESALPVMPNVFVKQNLKEGDLLISKDSNIGEIVILDKDYPNFMTSGAIYKLPVNEHKYYLLAFIKHQIFREQLDFMVPKGATIRHAKTMFLDCKIPIPNKDTAETIEFVEVLTQAIVNKEKLIKEKKKKILTLIDEELKLNQKKVAFRFNYPTIEDLENVGRLDTGLYNEKFKKLDFLITNYSFGYKTISEMNFKVVRGPNLAVSVIGLTHYADRPLSEKFYKLIQPTDLSEYGTIQTERYFGNSNNIQLLKEGDILFGAEGNIGKTYVILDLKERAVTNYHGMSITNDKISLVEKCFVGCFFFWFRDKKYFDFYSVGGQGGSFGKEKTENLKIPNFPIEIQTKITKEYHNEQVNYDTKNWNLENFLTNDSEFNKIAGIYELDKTANHLKAKLNLAIDNIVNDKSVKIDFA